ncbi:MAG: amidohydrolase family protein [Anaerolineae bacterium]|jgi:5-methylthioadenosine/S-adenosylhomocysteine deaminase
MTGSSQPSQQVDTILRGGTVLTMNPDRTIYAPGSVAVLGDAIVAVGPVAEIDAAYAATEIIDCSDHIVMPGLINTHTHAPMALLRGLADDLRLDVWLHGYILPVEREFVNPEFSFLGTLLSCAEMLRGGVTTFVDMYYHEEEVAWAAVQAGMRGVCGETVVKLPTPDAAAFEQGLTYLSDLIAHWEGHDLIVAVPAPHSIYLTTPEILRETTAIALQHDVPQLIHVSETAGEVDDWITATTRRPVRWLEERGILESKVVAAHCVHVNREEALLLAETGTGVAHNPTSNLKLASGIAPVWSMIEAGVHVGVGTDGCASNNDLDMFEEMRLAALLAKGVGGSPVALPAEDAVAMATIEGARAVFLDHLTGSLEPGKRADLIVLDMSRTHSLPHFQTTGLNVYSRIVYASHREDVRDVFVNGKQIVRDRVLLTVDESQILEQTRDMAQRINAFFVAREESVLDKLIDIGGLEQQETFEIQAKGIAPEGFDPAKALNTPEITITVHSSRDQYDTYMFFGDGQGERLRYREDNVLEPGGEIQPIYTLTLMGPAKEAELENSVVLSRARYTAPADRSLRFYREYFAPTAIREVSKHRERYHIRYKGVDLAVNVDRITAPPQPKLYIEIKSRTWSQQDAYRKASLIGELLHLLGSQPEDMLGQEYVDLVSTD